MRHIARKQAIDDLRERFLALTDDEHSICQVAAKNGFFCRGFAQWSFQELKQRYDWIVKRRPRITRKELERLANRWQVARQFVHDCDLACDNQASESHHQTCRGWNEFDDEQLAEYYREIFGEAVAIEPQPLEVD